MAVLPPQYAEDLLEGWRMRMEKQASANSKLGTTPILEQSGIPANLRSGNFISKFFVPDSDPV